MKKLLALTLSLLMVFAVVPMALAYAEVETVSNVIFDFEDQTGIGKHVGDAGSKYLDNSTLTDTFSYWKESAGSYSASVNGKGNSASFNLPTDWYKYYDATSDFTLTKPNMITFEVTCSSTAKAAQVNYVAFDTAAITEIISDNNCTQLSVVGVSKASAKTKATISCKIPAGLDFSKFTRFVVRIWGTNDACYVDNITLVYPLAYTATFQGTATAGLETAVEDEILDFVNGDTSITLPNATLADGKTFAGWVTADDTTTILPAGTVVELESDVEYFAVATDRAAYPTPDAPVVAEITDTTATLNATDGYLYSADGVTWQSSNVFTGLSPATEYTFYQKQAGDVAYLESAVSAGTKASTQAVYSIIFKTSEVTLSDNTMGLGFGANDGYSNIAKSSVAANSSVTVTSNAVVKAGVYNADLLARSYNGRAAVDVEINGVVMAQALNTSSGGTGDVKNMTYTLGSITIQEDSVVTIKFTAVASGSLYLNGLKLTKTADIQQEDENKVDVSMSAGAAIRLNAKRGIRFYTTVDAAKIAELKAAGKTVTMGTIIGPEDKIVGEFTHEDVCADVPFLSNEYFAENTIVGSIVDIRTTNIGRNFVGRGYVCVDGTYYYAEMNDNARSLKGVATACKADTATYEALDEAVKALVDGWAAAADWSAQ